MPAWDIRFRKSASPQTYRVLLCSQSIGQVFFVTQRGGRTLWQFDSSYGEDIPLLHGRGPTRKQAVCDALARIVCRYQWLLEVCGEAP